MTNVLGAQVPTQWRTARLKFLTSKIGRGTTPDYVDVGGVRVIGQVCNRVTGIDWGRTRFHASDRNAKDLKGHLAAGDVIVNSTGTGTLGRVGHFTQSIDDEPCIVDTHITIVRTKMEQLSSRFLYYWLNSLPFQEFIYAGLTAGSTNQIELDREALGNAPVPVPSLATQHRICEYLNHKLSQIDRLVPIRSSAEAERAGLRDNAIDRFSGKMRERRTALITAAVTGQFDVSAAGDQRVTE